MKTVTYTAAAAKEMKRQGSMAARVRKALTEYAADPLAHANNVTRMLGQAGCRMRVGDFRVIFEETETTLLVTKIGPRGGVYD